MLGPWIGTCKAADGHTVLAWLFRLCAFVGHTAYNRDVACQGCGHQGMRSVRFSKTKCMAMGSSREGGMVQGCRMEAAVSNGCEASI